MPRPADEPRTRGDAVFSRCRAYRYALWREWDPALPTVLFIGLNPSTADHRRDDPTIRRCIGFAKAWGYGGLAVGNLFAYRTPHPRVLKRAAAPIGRVNDRWLRRLAAEAELVVACWGVHGAHHDRATTVLGYLPPAKCLGTTKGGAPRHPLYLPCGAPLQTLPALDAGRSGR